MMFPIANGTQEDCSEEFLTNFQELHDYHKNQDPWQNVWNATEPRRNQIHFIIKFQFGTIRYHMVIKPSHYVPQ